VVTRRRVLAAAVVAVLAVVAVGVVLAGRGPAAIRRQVLSVPVGPDANGRPVRLDATLFRPNGAGRHPAVVLAHGFGGSKDGETADALSLARDGYVVLTYSARGFGRSGGEIGLDSPDYEVQDARRLVDLLAARPDVTLDGPGNPRVGFAGASYGGGLSLLVAGYDPRVDAIVPIITWHDLREAFLPQSYAGPGAQAPGVFKRLWAGVFFGSGSAPTGRGGPTTCGRFTAAICAAYQATAATGRPTPGILALLARSSPSMILDRITAPTLLIQGESDSLFPLGQATANARGIAAHGTPVKVVWYGGGHDGGNDETARLRTLTRGWFDRYLRRDGSRPDTRFEYTAIGAGPSSGDSTPRAAIRIAPAFPELHGGPPTTAVTLTGGEQTVVAPAGGVPAAVTALPGLGSLLGAVGGGAVGGALPGQTARFDSPPLARTVHVVGPPRVTLRVTGTRDATLFAGLYDVGPDGSAALPQQLVAPLRIPTVAGGATVRVALPAVVHDFPAGHRLRVQVSTTDQSYALPQTARSYHIALAADTVTLPVGTGSTVGGSSALPYLLGAGALAALAAAAAWWAARLRRRRAATPDPGLVDVPLVTEGLGKAYRSGFRAVSDLSIRVEHGEVLGLLGPNGAGKTTTLRMLMGLIFPTEGAIRVFGHRIEPGAPVLSRVGSFVEGPGFLPHLSGIDNLTLYWRATGRPAGDAQLQLALEIAGLGADVERKVRTYSHGMRQRLAIAQAMLGLPDLLVLDEPTNGLDPPQIREMRAVLIRYAATGRTVIVSSHLLAEVEQTCTHVVVMNRGRLVAAGSVAELIGGASSIAVDVDDPRRAAAVAAALPGVSGVTLTSTGMTLSLDGTPRAELVRRLVGAGLAIDRVAPQRQLEEVFLDLVGGE